MISQGAAVVEIDHELTNVANNVVELMMRMVVKVKLLIQMMMMMCLSVSHYCPAVEPPPRPPTLLHCMQTDCDEDENLANLVQGKLPSEWLWEQIPTDQIQNDTLVFHLAVPACL